MAPHVTAWPWQNFLEKGDILVQWDDELEDKVPQVFARQIFGPDKYGPKVRPLQIKVPDNPSPRFP